MKVKMHLAKWTISLTLFCSVMIAAPLRADSETSYAEIYTQTGLDQQLEFLWQEISAEYTGLTKTSSHPLVEQSIHTLIKDEFAEIQLRNTILEHWGKQLSNEDLATVSEWLTSPAGSQLTTAEINASTSTDESALSNYLASLRLKPPSTKRIELLRLLDTAVHSSDASTDIGIHINLAAVTALHYSGFAPEGSKSPAEKAQVHESDRSLIRAMMRQDMLRHNLYVYRELEDKTLRAYIEFAESPTGARFHKSTFFAMRAALSAATKELKNEIQGLMPKPKITAQLTTE